MKRNHEEELIQLAFGELSQEAAENLERQAAEDSKAASTLQTYKNMKEGLQALREIPEPQLSTERLREAILRDGLKKERTWSGLSWVLGPAAAGVLAFAAYTLINRGGVDPSHLPGAGSGSLVEGGPVASNMNDFALERPSLEQMLGRFDFSGPSESNQNQMIADSEKRTRTSSKRRVAPEVLRNEPKEPEIGNFSVGRGEDGRFSASTLDGASAGGAAPSATREASFATVAASVDPGSEIVLIEDEMDSGTGTNRAKELESSTNVLIGG